ncbi:MAG: molybdopterin molybdotransferase MoeA [Oscillospiraceae bacterium]|nr:molybdopterin molybdotransferase MoeA [Oscillospiraceae bacterium]
MLQVMTPDEVLSLIDGQFHPLNIQERVSLYDAVGRVLAEDVCAGEYVPDFDRSTVDGYAVRASDTFGCSDAIPAILPVSAEVLMGQAADFTLSPFECCAVPTGGAVPGGADACVMIEYTEDYGDGTVGILKPAAPGQNMIFRGDDVYPGKPVLSAGRLLSSQDVGALAAMGITEVSVSKRLSVGVISTGDELVPPEDKPSAGQVRDVNAPMLCAMLKAYGAEVRSFGIVRDDERLLGEVVRRAAEGCDLVLISGGSSVGVKDASCRIIESMGTLLLHGIAMKPGKPTIMGKTGSGKPLVGLPGHPVAAYFVTKLFVLPLLARLEGRIAERYTVTARLTESVGANHGRAQYGCVRLERRADGLWAHPIRSKSGLITSLAGADGFFCIDRDCEGLPGGAAVEITVCSGD